MRLAWGCTHSTWIEGKETHWSCLRRAQCTICKVRTHMHTRTHAVHTNPRRCPTQFGALPRCFSFFFPHPRPRVSLPAACRVHGLCWGSSRVQWQLLCRRLVASVHAPRQKVSNPGLLASVICLRPGWGLTDSARAGPSFLFAARHREQFVLRGNPSV